MKTQNKILVLVMLALAASQSASAQITNVLSTGYASLDAGGAALASAANWGMPVGAVVMAFGIGIGWLAALRRRRV